MINPLTSYIAELNAQAPNSPCKLTDDLAHWAGYGITTPEQLGEYLDACARKNAEDDARDSYGDDGDDVSEFDDDQMTGEDGGPLGSFDSSDDAEALASAGYGTDEDYGCYGGEDSFLDSYYESQTECDFGE